MVDIDKIIKGILGAILLIFSALFVQQQINYPGESIYNSTSISNNVMAMSIEHETYQCFLGECEVFVVVENKQDSQMNTSIMIKGKNINNATMYSLKDFIEEQEQIIYKNTTEEIERINDVSKKSTKENVTYSAIDKIIKVNKTVQKYVETDNVIVNNKNKTTVKLNFKVPKDSSGKFDVVYNNSGTLMVIDPWWNSSWLHKQEINISTASGTTEQNYTVQIKLNTTNVGPSYNWSMTCNDTRFANSSEDGALDYWVELCNTTNAIIWVEVDVNITTTPTTIFMYYGNSDATTSTSNGTATFLAFDDFNDNTYSASWTPSNGSCGNVYERNSRLEFQALGAGGACGRAWDKYNTQFAEPYAIDFYGYGQDTGSNPTYHFIAFRWDGVVTGNYRVPEDAMQVDFLDAQTALGPGRIWNYTAGSGALIVSSASVLKNQTWYRFSIRDNATNISLYYDDLPLITNYTTTYNPGDYIGLSHREYAISATNKYVYYDDYRIRKYTTVEPTATMGNEIYVGTNITIWNGTSYIIYNSTNIIQFRCGPTFPGYCITKNQDADHSILKDCNNGTVASAYQQIKVNDTWNGQADLICGTLFDKSDVVNLTTSYINYSETSLAAADCRNIFCWLNVTTDTIDYETFPRFFEITINNSYVS